MKYLLALVSLLVFPIAQAQSPQQNLSSLAQSLQTGGIVPLTNGGLGANVPTPVSSECLSWNGSAFVWATCSGGGGSMTWPGLAGIPNYTGASSWGTSYSASNNIPANFLPPALSSSTSVNGTTIAASAGTAAGSTGAFTLNDCLKVGSVSPLEIADNGAACGAGGGMVYPGAGIPNSTGTAWGTSYTTTGSGTVVALATSPAFTTPSLGAATATSLNGNTFTAGTYTLTGSAGKTLTFSNSLTLAGTDATTMTFPATSQTIAGLGAAQTWAAVQTFPTSDVAIKGSSTGTTAIASANASASNFTATLPANTGTLGELNLAQTWSALQTFGTNISIGGVTAGGATGTGNVVFATSPTLTTPNLGTPSAITLTNGTGLPLSGLATQTADTVVGNASGVTASPTAVALTSCSTASSALTYNTTTHAFGCNTISGSGTVNSATSGQLAYYSATGTAVSGATVGSGLTLASSTLSTTQAINAQTGTTYTIVSTDAGKLVTFTNASAIAVALPQATGSFGAGFAFTVENVGTAGTVTITPTTSTIGGSGTLVVPPGLGCSIVSDGTNYQVGACTAYLDAINNRGSGTSLTPFCNAGAATTVNTYTATGNLTINLPSECVDGQGVKLRIKFTASVTYTWNGGYHAGSTTGITALPTASSSASGEDYFQFDDDTANSRFNYLAIASF